MVTIAQYKNCSTAGLRALDLQLIGQMGRIAPGLLIRVEHPKIVVGAGCHPYLQAPAAKALVRAINRRGTQLAWNSGYRTLPQQAVIFNWFQLGQCGITAAARPGASNHNTGLAIDVDDPAGWKPYLEAEGWDWLGSWDRWHYDYRGAGCKDLRFISIKAFQQLWNFNYPDRKIAEDGKWGLKTMMAMKACEVEGFPKVPGRAIAVAPPERKPESAPLREGAEGAEVVRLQKALCGAGCAVAPDGKFGQQTLAAVKQFQLNHGLTADGVVGRQTWQALG